MQAPKSCNDSNAQLRNCRFLLPQSNGQFQTGKGIIGEGTIVNIRLHSVMSSSDVTRYTAIVLKINHAQERVTDKYGAEVTPNFKTGVNCGKKTNK